MRRRLFPFPVLSLVLFVCWQLLIGEMSVAHILLGLLLAWGLPKLSKDFLGHLPPVRSPSAAIRLIALVTWDIVVANIAVARMVLGPIQRAAPHLYSCPGGADESAFQGIARQHHHDDPRHGIG